MFIKDDEKVKDQGVGRIRIVEVCVSVKVKISEEAFEKFEAQGTAADYLAEKAIKQIVNGNDVDVSYYDFNKRILKDVA